MVYADVVLGFALLPSLLKFMSRLDETGLTFTELFTALSYCPIPLAPFVLLVGLLGFGAAATTIVSFRFLSRSGFGATRCGMAQLACDEIRAVVFGALFLFSAFLPLLRIYRTGSIVVYFERPIVHRDGMPPGVPNRSAPHRSAGVGRVSRAGGCLALVFSTAAAERSAQPPRPTPPEAKTIGSHFRSPQQTVLRDAARWPSAPFDRSLRAKRTVTNSQVYTVPTIRIVPIVIVQKVTSRFFRGPLTARRSASATRPRLPARSPRNRSQPI
jgi:hypothetical protein